MPVVSVVFCQVEVSATSLSLVQRSTTDCSASLYVILKLRKWGVPGPMGSVAPNKKNYLHSIWESNEKFGSFFIKRKSEMVMAVIPSMSSKMS